jgi:hypothetical protein
MFFEDLTSFYRDYVILMNSSFISTVLEGTLIKYLAYIWRCEPWALRNTCLQ